MGRSPKAEEDKLVDYTLRLPQDTLEAIRMYSAYSHLPVQELLRWTIMTGLPVIESMFSCHVTLVKQLQTVINAQVFPQLDSAMLEKIKEKILASKHVNVNINIKEAPVQPVPPVNETITVPPVTEAPARSPAQVKDLDISKTLEEQLGPLDADASAV